MTKKGPDPFSRAARLGAALVLLVVIAAAGIRYDVDTTVLRPIHRVAASLEVPVALWIAWLAWRSERSFLPAALFALALTVLLSVVGIYGGRNPPPAIVATNLFCGLALAAAFAWIAGREKRGQDPFPAIRVLTPLFAQVALGAGVSLAAGALFLPVHGLLAMALAALLAWFALARVGGGAGRLLFVLALTAPIAGMTSLQYEHSALAALAHAATAALLVCMAAYSCARGTGSIPQRAHIDGI